MEAGAGRGASRTRSRPDRLVRVLKDPSEMLVSWLLPCSGMGRVWGNEAVVDIAHGGEENAPK